MSPTVLSEAQFPRVLFSCSSTRSGVAKLEVAQATNVLAFPQLVAYANSGGKLTATSSLLRRKPLRASRASGHSCSWRIEQRADRYPRHNATERRFLPRASAGAEAGFVEATAGRREGAERDIFTAAQTRVLEDLEHKQEGNHPHGHDHDHEQSHGHSPDQAHSRGHEHDNDHSHTVNCCSHLSVSDHSHHEGHDHGEERDHGQHNHNHHQEIDHHEHHHHAHAGHSHCHSCHSDLSNINGLQEAILTAARAVRLTNIADALRHSVPLALTSLGFCLAAYAVPMIVKDNIGEICHNALVIAALAISGIPALLDAAIDIAGARINIHVLMALAAFASIFMGTALEGTLLLAMFNLSHVAEEYFTEKALGDVNELRESHPETALQLEAFDRSAAAPLSSFGFKEISIRDIEVGMYLLVRQGEAVPVDGEVWYGRAMVTVEHLTGEATPLQLKAGDGVTGGARSLDGMLVIKATKVWSDSTVARIMELTREAQRHRPQLQRWLTQFGEVYSRAVVGLALGVALLGPLLFKWPFLSSGAVRGSVYRALGVMVAASPCALAAAPLAYATAISACAAQGILLRGGRALDALAACSTVAFDKTGTLTTGDLLCKFIEPLHGHQAHLPEATQEGALQKERKGEGEGEGGAVTKNECCAPTCEEEALAVASAMEQAATHPIARAVLEASEGRKLPAVTVEDWVAVPGQGLAATVTTFQQDGAKGQGPCRARLGSVEYIMEASANADIIRSAVASSLNSKELVMAALAIDEKVTLFHFEDKVREGVGAVVDRLQGEGGLRLLMLTGDHAASARRVAEPLGIKEVHSGLKPEDKLAHVRSLADAAAKEGRGGLVMVGDGINDAPALAAATVGIVLAQRASATAVAAADVLLLKDSIEGVPFVIAKARQTTTLVKQSVALALLCGFLGGLVSVLGFSPLWFTVLLHEGGTLLVCLNSTRAFQRPKMSQGGIGLWISQTIQNIMRAIQNVLLSRNKVEMGGNVKAPDVSLKHTCCT